MCISLVITYIKYTGAHQNDLTTHGEVRAGYNPAPGLEGEGMNGNCTFAGNRPIPAWAACGVDPEGCTSDQIAVVNAWMKSFMSDYFGAGVTPTRDLDPRELFLGPKKY